MPQQAFDCRIQTNIRAEQQLRRRPYNEIVRATNSAAAAAAATRLSWQTQAARQRWMAGRQRRAPPHAVVTRSGHAA